MKDNKKIKVLIVDDEVLIAEQLNLILQELNYEVSGIAYNQSSAIEKLQATPPDIAILDIKINGENQGFEIAKFIRENMNIPFVFLTSFADKSTVNEASELTPDAYLLKPFDETDIFSTLKIVLNRHNKINSYFTIKSGHKTHKVKEDDLLYIKSADKYIEIYTKTKRYLKRESINTFITNNNLQDVIRVHRSYAVKLNNIDYVNGSELFISNQKIPISNTYKNSFKKAFDSL